MKKRETKAMWDDGRHVNKRRVNS